MVAGSSSPTPATTIPGEDSDSSIHVTNPSRRVTIGGPSAGKSPALTSKSERGNTMKLRRKPVKFQNRNHAFSYADNPASYARVVHGDDGLFWVVCPADAATLEKNGYEVIR